MKQKLSLSSQGHSKNGQTKWPIIEGTQLFFFIILSPSVKGREF